MKIRRYIILLTGLLSVIIFINHLWAITAPFTDDMEDVVSTWSSDNDWIGGPNTLGGPNPPSFTAPPPLVHPSWNKCWGTNLNGKYTNNTTSTLTSPQIDLVSAPKPFLSFYAWYKIAAGDYATAEVSTVGVGGPWNVLESIGPGSDSSSIPGNINGWIRKPYDLSPYTGLNYTGSIYVRFTLSADDNNATRNLGLYIDDVAVGTNLDTQNRYVIALEPESTPVSTTTLNDMTVWVEVRDLFKYIDNATNEVTIQTVQDGPNDSSLSQITPSPVYLSGGKATFTFRDTERENVTFTPSVTISGQSLTSISTIGKFLSPFRKSWEEKE